jgi:hypothetical protein
MAIKGPTKDHAEIRGWAKTHGIVPATIEPNRIDSEPACMTLLHKMTVDETSFAKEMAWEEFFMRMDLLGLAVVYDDSTVFNEILQVDDSNPHTPPAYRWVTSHH